MKCTNGHDMTQESKHCGECGSTAAEEILKATCGGCQTEQLASHKHCIECGETMIKAAEAELDAALAELSEFHKARAALKDTLDVPLFDPKAVELVKAGEGGGTPGDDNGGGGDEEVSTFLKALIAGHNHTREHLRLVGDAVQQTRKDQGLIVKALSAGLVSLGKQVADLKKDLAVGKAQRQPRRSVLNAFEKAATQDVVRDRDENESPLIREMFPLGRSTEMMKAGLLGSADPTQIQFYAERGASLADVAEQDPGLANRIATALRTVADRAATTH